MQFGVQLKISGITIYN